MSVPFISCPNCNTMLLSDTDQCPSCRHVFGRGSLVEIGPADAGSDVAFTGHEDPCPSCGEMVRRGLVRCWNCSTFMREDIAQSYHGMQQSPSPVTYSRLPGDEDTGNSPTYQFEELNNESLSDGWFDDALLNMPDIADDDLLLAPLVNPESEEDDFESAPGFEPRSDENAVTEITADLETTSTVSSDVYDVIPSNRDGGTASWTTGDSMTPEHPAVSSDTDPSTTSSAPADNDRSPTSASSGDEADMPHSVATAGDVLLQAALDQEAEATQRRKKLGRQVAPGCLLVYCPNGHRVEVSEKHRGQTGRCPKCKSPFFVPASAWEAPTPTAGAASTTADGASEGQAPDEIGQELRWMEDIRLHTIDPSKLKLKAGSLALEFQPVDLGFSGDHILMVNLAAGKKGGLFGGKKKKTPADDPRETVRTELGQDKPLDELSAAWSGIIEAEAVNSIVIIQPAEDDYSSMFAGIPVFGEKRIAVRIPKAEGESLLRFLSFELSTFRQFSQNLSEVFHVSLSAEEFGIPMADSFVKKTCYYTDQTLMALQDVEFYQADPSFDVKLIGRECQGCQLTFSEDSRKKEKIGGTSGKGIAKAKCPKCNLPFGDISLFTIDVAKTTVDNEMSGEEMSGDSEETTEESDNGTDNRTDEESAT